MLAYALMIVDGVFRGRFRKIFANPEAVTRGRVGEYTIDLHGTYHVFKKGYKINGMFSVTYLFPR